MDNTLLKYSAKDHFFKAVLCQLCVDRLNGEQALNRFKDIHPAFADSRECKFLEVSCGQIIPRLFLVYFQSISSIFSVYLHTISRQFRLITLHILIIVRFP